MLNENKNYKELVEKAEIELNNELDNIKNGNISQSTNINKNKNNDEIKIEKRINLIDKKRNIYKVTVFAHESDKKITLEGYEKKDEYD